MSTVEASPTATSAPAAPVLSPTMRARPAHLRRRLGGAGAVFGLFAGFWLSYATLVLGLTHNWFAIPAEAVTDSVTLFQLTWAIVFGALTLATLRLPVSFTAVFALVVVALVLLIFAGQNASTTLTHVAGVVALMFAAVGAYLFASAADVAGGGKGYPLGSPLVK